MAEADYRNTVICSPGAHHDAIRDIGVDAFVRSLCPEASRKSAYMLIAWREIPQGWVIITDDRLDRYTFESAPELS